MLTQSRVHQSNIQSRSQTLALKPSSGSLVPPGLVAFPTN